MLVKGGTGLYYQWDQKNYTCFIASVFTAGYYKWYPENVLHQFSYWDKGRNLGVYFSQSQTGYDRACLFPRSYIQELDRRSYGWYMGGLHKYFKYREYLGLWAVVSMILNAMFGVDILWCIMFCELTNRPLFLTQYEITKASALLQALAW